MIEKHSDEQHAAEVEGAKRFYGIHERHPAVEGDEHWERVPEPKEHDPRYADQTDDDGAGIQAKITQERIRITVDSYSPFGQNVYLKPEQAHEFADQLYHLARELWAQWNASTNSNDEGVDIIEFGKKK